jgi:hypothetical protein
MTKHGSASTRKHESHASNGNFTRQITQLGSQGVGSSLANELAIAAREYDRKGVPRKSDVNDANLKRRARMLAVDGRVDHGTRKMIRYALENRDPYLVQLVARVERGEMRIEHLILDTD